MECPLHKGTELLEVVDTTACPTCGAPGTQVRSFACVACSRTYDLNGAQIGPDPVVVTPTVPSPGFAVGSSPAPRPVVDKEKAAEALKVQRDLAQSRTQPAAPPKPGVRTDS